MTKMKRRRQQLKLSRSAAARKARISLIKFARIENGDDMPDEDQARRLSEVLLLDPDELQEPITVGEAAGV